MFKFYFPRIFSCILVMVPVWLGYFRYSSPRKSRLLHVSWDVWHCWEWRYTEDNGSYKWYQSLTSSCLACTISRLYLCVQQSFWLLFVQFGHVKKCFYMLSLYVKHFNVITSRKTHWNPIKIKQHMRCAAGIQHGRPTALGSVFVIFGCVLGFVCCVFHMTITSWHV